jgi:hypothetical protein
MVEMDFEYLPTIEGPPVTPRQLYAQACSNDTTTIDSWRKIWVEQYKINHERHGPFKDKSAAQFHNLFRLKPCIVAGSGPSLKNNAKLLADRKGIPLISCLHNFGFFERPDINVKPDFYLTLDSGGIVLDDLTEGGNGAEPSKLWEATKNHKLLAYTASPPDLLEKWQGEIYFFNSVIPDMAIVEEQEKVEKFRFYFSTGGNALGACVYAAKALCAANPIIYTGADFAFDYSSTFHPWKSSVYDKKGQFQRAMNCFGHMVKTWPSYYNFKCFFDYLSCTVPGIYINATEGGCLGAYPEGNIKQIIQMPLEKVIQMYNLSNEAPTGPEGKTTINVKEVFENPETETRFCMY